MSEFKQDLAVIRSKFQAGDYNEAHELAKQMHIKYHPEALSHARVHFLLAGINYRKRAYIKSLGNCIAGINFAIPSSLAQKYLGIQFVEQKHE
ncbi:MAG: hypothetical protein JKY67_13825 [Pseudomonadales bacterium]|nr:hypothetical protein [Pseudomonadales bacterium]